jgi:hypothetical protein
VDAQHARVKDLQMKRHLWLLLAVLVLVAGFTFTQQEFSVIRWGYDGGDGKGQVLRSYMAVNPDGGILLRSTQHNATTHIALYPTYDGEVEPGNGAKTEIVLYGDSDDRPGHNEQNFERFSVSQMNQNERMLRFSVERGGNGLFRPMQFCFDSYLPGVAYCPFRITPDNGVQVCDVNNVCQRIGG